jgi:site-specific DNA recombinase
LLEDPSRTTTRPARAVYLLSYIARCGECGGPLSGQKYRRGSTAGKLMYACLKRHCTTVLMEYLDEYIERIVVKWLTAADVHAALHRATTDRETSAACAEAQRLRAELEDYKKLAETGEIKAIDYVRFERGLTARIAEAETHAQEVSIPPVLRGRIGEHAAREWARLADNLAVKRDIIREILSIELLKTGADNRTFGPHRLRLAWTYGHTKPATPTPNTAATSARTRATQR